MLEVDEDEDDIKEARAEVEAIVAQKLSEKFPSRGQRTSIPIVRSKWIMRQEESLNVIKAIARMKASAQREYLLYNALPLHLTQWGYVFDCLAFSAPCLKPIPVQSPPKN